MTYSKIKTYENRSSQSLQIDMKLFFLILLYFDPEYIQFCRNQLFHTIRTFFVCKWIILNYENISHIEFRDN